MKPAISLPISLAIVLLGLLSEVSSSQNLPKISQVPNIAQVIEVKGLVEVKHPSSGGKSAQWQPIKRGTYLRRGDLLRVKRPGRAVVRCTENTNKLLTRTVPDDGIPWGVTSICSPISSQR